MRLFHKQNYRYFVCSCTIYVNMEISRINNINAMHINRFYWIYAYCIYTCFIWSIALIYCQKIIEIVCQNRGVKVIKINGVSNNEIVTNNNLWQDHKTKNRKWNDFLLFVRGKNSKKYKQIKPFDIYVTSTIERWVVFGRECVDAIGVAISW